MESREGGVYLTADAPPSAPTTNRARTVRGDDSCMEGGNDGVEVVGEVGVEVARGEMVTCAASSTRTVDDDDDDDGDDAKGTSISVMEAPKMKSTE